MRQLLRARRLLTGQGWLDDQQLRMDRGVITAIEPIPAGVNTREADLLCPAYIDIHVHGGAGVDVMDDAPDVLDRLAMHKAREGVGRFCLPPSPLRWRRSMARYGALPDAVMPVAPARRSWAAIWKARTLHRRTKGRTRQNCFANWISRNLMS